jgi:hypothetical protein
VMSEEPYLHHATAGVTHTLSCCLHPTLNRLATLGSARALVGRRAKRWKISIIA